MAKYKQLKEAEYDMIKMMLDAKLPKVKVCKATGRSEATIHYIAKSTSYSDYKEIINAMLKRSEDKRNGKAQGEAPELTAFSEQEFRAIVLQELKEIKEALTTQKTFSPKSFGIRGATSTPYATGSARRSANGMRNN